jgi:hypothetical protein
MSQDEAKADQLASPHLDGTPISLLSANAAVHCTRSSRGEWKTFCAGRLGGADDEVVVSARYAALHDHVSPIETLL